MLTSACRALIQAKISAWVAVVIGQSAAATAGTAVSTPLVIVLSWKMKFWNYSRYFKKNCFSTTYSWTCACKSSVQSGCIYNSSYSNESCCHSCQQCHRIRLKKKNKKLKTFLKKIYHIYYRYTMELINIHVVLTLSISCLSVRRCL